MRCVLTLVLVAFVLSPAQIFHDTVLFVVPLKDDPASLYHCDRNLRTRDGLSGPVVMADTNLLLYSSKGYVLYERNGVVADSHSVMPLNKGFAPDAPDAYTLACPVDQTTLLYYRTSAKSDEKLEVFYKKLYKKRLKEVAEEARKQMVPLAKGVVYNIAHNTRTDEMASIVYYRPQLVGFTALTGGARWWSVDRFYTFASPLIMERNNVFVSFFPGIRPAGRSGKEVKDAALDVAGTFRRGGRRYYVGISAPLGAAKARQWQTIYICDDAGNALHVDSLLKQTIGDVVLGRDNDPRKNVIYTATSVKTFVFPPVVDATGNLFYGALDYDRKKLSVHKRAYAVYLAGPAEADLAHQIDVERDISFEPISITCSPQLKKGARIPSVRFTDDKGQRRAATSRDLSVNGFVARISRGIYRDISAKLSRRASGLPAAVELMRDSLRSNASVGCPYTVSVSGPKGVIRAIDYPAGEQIMCARVIAQRDNDELLVRVDLDKRAEMLILMPDGRFVNRFTFNRQPAVDRNDIIVASGKSPIYEVDYERNPGVPKHRSWTPLVKR